MSPDTCYPFGSIQTLEGSVIEDHARGGHQNASLQGLPLGDPRPRRVRGAAPLTQGGVSGTIQDSSSHDTANSRAALHSRRKALEGCFIKLRVHRDPQARRPLWDHRRTDRPNIEAVALQLQRCRYRPNVIAKNNRDDL